MASHLAHKVIFLLFRSASYPIFRITFFANLHIAWIRFQTLTSDLVIGRDNMQKVQERYPHLKQKVSPHTLRHTKAMHLVQGGVSLDIVRDFLGHVDIKTTELYARANLEMKRAAIEKVSPAPVPNIPSWKENKSLLQWLQRL